MGWAVVTLLAQVAACGVAICAADHLHLTSRPGREGRPESDIAPVLAGAALIVLSVWLWFSFVSYGIIRLFGAAPSFDSVFAATVFGGIPALIPWLSYPLYNLSWTANRAWVILTLVSQLCATETLWWTFHVRLGLPWWIALASILPLLALSWFIAVWEIRDLPSTIQASHPWRRKCGNTVTIFYPASADADEIAAIADGCEETLEKAAGVLKADLPRRKVAVFLYPDEQAFRKILNIEELCAQGYAHSNGISLLYGRWESIQSTVAHEFAHVLQRDRPGERVSGLLGEGCAVYVEAELSGQGDAETVTLLPTPLRSMAFPTVFYDGLGSPAGRHQVSRSYEYAHSFVRWFITHYGMTKFQTLYKKAAGDYWRGCGQRLADSIEGVCDESIDQVETRWRAWEKSRPRFSRGRGLRDEALKRFTECGRRVILTAGEKAARLKQPTITADHILLGLLQHPEAPSARLLASLEIDVTAEVFRGSLPVDDALPSAERRVSLGGCSVLDRAYDEARKSGETLIASDHLLLGLLQVDCAGRRLLNDRGVSIESARAARSETAGSTLPLPTNGTWPGDGPSA